MFLKFHLFRPFPNEDFISVLPKSVKKIAVLDRTKEPGSNGEPMYQDILVCLTEALTNGTLEKMPKIIGGRYGLSSKEFTPAMVKAVYDNLKPKILKPFYVGITDDVSFTSIDVDYNFQIR